MLAVFFAILAVLEVRNSVINAFVLITIAAIFLKGAIVRKKSYELVGSMLATVFGVLMILAYLATREFSFAILGVVTLPVFLVDLKKFKA